MRGSGEIPVVETERLRMRGHRVGDFEECVAMWAAPEVTRLHALPNILKHPLA
jgi:hypothetical protein